MVAYKALAARRLADNGRVVQKPESLENVPV
jgi:hypothetical protein